MMVMVNGDGNGDGDGDDGEWWYICDNSHWPNVFMSKDISTVFNKYEIETDCKQSKNINNPKICSLQCTVGKLKIIEKQVKVKI